MKPSAALPSRTTGSSVVIRSGTEAQICGGSCLTVGLSDSGSVGWTFDVDATLPEGRHRLGTLVPPPVVTGSASRIVGFASCPGVVQWTVTARGPFGASGRLSLACSDGGIGIGVYPVGSLPVAEQWMPRYEDNARGVALTDRRPLPGSDVGYRLMESSDPYVTVSTVATLLRRVRVSIGGTAAPYNTLPGYLVLVPHGSMPWSNQPQNVFDRANVVAIPLSGTSAVVDFDDVVYPNGLTLFATSDPYSTAIPSPAYPVGSPYWYAANPSIPAGTALPPRMLVTVAP